MSQLVLALFSGIGLLDMAFEEEGFQVVRGPDALWGGDIHRFHVPWGRFNGVIGGPPCQAFSRLVHLVRSLYGEAAVKPNLIPEFERVVGEAQPQWFLMENVPDAPAPHVDGYTTSQRLLRHDAVGGPTSRTRRFTFGMHGEAGRCDCGHWLADHGDACAFCSCCDPVAAEIPINLPIEELALHPIEVQPTVCATAGGRRVPVAMVRDGNGGLKRKRSKMPHDTTRPINVMCELQGLPGDFLDGTPFTLAGKRIMIGNGVPLPMGRAVARAVKRALGIEELVGAISEDQTK